LTEALDLTTPAGRAMAGLLAVFAANSNGRSWVSELGLDWPMPGRNGKRLGRPATAAAHAAEDPETTSRWRRKS